MLMDHTIDPALMFHLQKPAVYPLTDAITAGLSGELCLLEPCPRPIKSPHLCGVVPFFERLKRMKTDNGARTFDRIVVGVISNSDDRVPAVLKSLGLTVGDVRADQERSSMELPGFEERSRMDENAKILSSALYSPSESIEPVNDIDMVITSYEAGEEKPHKLIFDVAKRQAQRFVESMHGKTTESVSADNWIFIHVGDDYQKDYRGAIDAGWNSFLLPREPLGDDVQDAKRIDTLLELIPKLEGYNG